MEVTLIPQEIEYRAFQFALFKRKITISKDAISFNSKVIKASNIVAILYGRTNKVAGNRIVKSYYKVELKDKNGACIKISFSHMVSQGKPEVLEKVYFDLLNSLTPIMSNIYNQSFSLISSGKTLEHGNLKINNKGVEIKPEFLSRGAIIPWDRLDVKYQNGAITIFDGGKAAANYYFNSTWNLKIIEDICRSMIRDRVGVALR